MKSNGLCILLEQLRSARNISQTEFVGDVISMRQYRRYLRGESDLPFTILAQLAEKLSLTTDIILREYETARIKETQLINKLYNLSVNYSFEEFNQLRRQLHPDKIMERSNVLLYRHSIAMYAYFKKEYTLEQAKNVNIKLINYPDVLNQGVLNTVEMLILTFLIDILPEDEKNKIIDKLSAYLYNPKTIVSGGNDKVLILILARLAKHAGILESYDQVIKLCDYGIEFNKTKYCYYLMDYFYYYKTLAYQKLNDKDNFEKSLKKCFEILEFEGNESKINKFNLLITEDYNFDFKSHVIHLYENELKK